MPDDPHKSDQIRDFCRVVCRDDLEALQFCDTWFAYCHGIDDLIDTAEDGRPTMPAEEQIRLFLCAAMLYNGPFYQKHQKHLFPVVLLVTNAYADSVAWEQSPIKRRRLIADVLRCCGNEMFFMVAMLVGGVEHMRELSPRIRERSWMLQHDENDEPN